MRKNISKFVVSTLLLLSLMGCAPRRAQAQFIGFVGQQTTRQTALTGATTPTTFLINDVSQNMHFLSYTKTGGTTAFDLRLEGSNDGITFFPISDDAIDTFSTSGILYAVGWYSVVRVNLVSIAGGSVSAVYSGTSSTSSPPVGAYGQGFPSRKIVFNTVSEGSAQAVAVQPPFNSTLGYLVVVGSGPFPANSTLVVNGTVGNGNFYTIGNYQLGGSTTFTFPVPFYPASSVNITYSSGGASANTFSAYYFYYPTGSLPGVLQSGSFVTVGCTGTALNGSTPVIGTFVSCTPLQLGVNAITEPAAGTTALSNIIDTRGAKQADLKYSCTAGTVTVNVQEYAEDGSTTLALVSPVSGVAAAANGDVYIGSESNPAVDTGTLATPPAGVVRFPQRALAFSFTNAGGAGTCTARLFLSY